MIEALNADRMQVGEAALRVGFGIATGEVVAGYAGTDARATYTCIGKTVNLASRLEAHTKKVGATILLDGQTRDSLDDPKVCQAIPDVRFKGFSETLVVYTA